jgi:transposase
MLRHEQSAALPWTGETGPSQGRTPEGIRAAAAYTFKFNDVDPQAWLADELARLPDHPASRIAELLPWNWKAARFDIAA